MHCLAGWIVVFGEVAHLEECWYCADSAAAGEAGDCAVVLFGVAAAAVPPVQFVVPINNDL